MSETGHDTPEKAAMVGFPPAHCRVVACQSHEDDAYVVLDTGAPGQPYLYGVNCYREHGKWFESTSSNGPGWSQMGDDPDLGTLSFWDDAPVGADAVRIEFSGTSIEAPVRLGAFLVVWWRVADPTDDWPRIVAVREAGVWRSESAGLRSG